jgi:hypothetical protein
MWRKERSEELLEKKNMRKKYMNLGRKDERKKGYRFPFIGVGGDFHLEPESIGDQ